MTTFPAPQLDSACVPDVPGYAGLQRVMHDAVRAQHPEWIESDGTSPTCDYYESRFAALLVSHRAHERARRDSSTAGCELEEVVGVAGGFR